MESRISIITLGVSDLERSLRFYRDGLGLPTTWAADKGIVFFQTQGVCLALYPFDELAKDDVYGKATIEEILYWTVVAAEESREMNTWEGRRSI